MYWHRFYYGLVSSGNSIIHCLKPSFSYISCNYAITIFYYSFSRDNEKMNMGHLRRCKMSFHCKKCSQFIFSFDQDNLIAISYAIIIPQIHILWCLIRLQGQVTKVVFDCVTGVNWCNSGQIFFCVKRITKKRKINNPVFHHAISVLFIRNLNHHLNWIHLKWISEWYKKYI